MPSRIAQGNLQDGKPRLGPGSIAKLRRQKPGKAAGLIEMHIDETLSDDSFPNSHWLKMRTNNPLKRIMKEIRRRTRVVGAFPDGQSCLNPTGARLRHIAGISGSPEPCAWCRGGLALQQLGYSVAGYNPFRPFATRADLDIETLWQAAKPITDDMDVAQDRIWVVVTTIACYDDSHMRGQSVKERHSPELSDFGKF